MKQPRTTFALISRTVLLGAALLAAPAFAGEPPSAVLDVRLQVVESAVPQLPEAGRVILERTDQHLEAPLVLPAKPVLSLSVPVPSRWLISFDVPGLWGPKGPIDVAPATPTGWVFNLRPAGRLVGRLTSRNLLLPKEIGIFSELASGARAESRCPLKEKGDFDCAVPAGSQEVLITAGTFAPVRFRGQKVVAGKALTLPTTELQPGSSLVGRVVTRDGTDASAEPATQVRVFRFVAHAKSTAPPKPLAEGRLGADGTFSFVGLEPGPVVLEITRGGYSPARLFPIELPAGAEVALPDPIELSRPFEAVFEVKPPADSFGLPWSVSLQHRVPGEGADALEPPIVGQTDSEGLFRLTDQPAGPAYLEIRDSAGNRFYDDGDLWLEAGEPRITIDLPVIEVRGTVSHAGEAVAATLYFGGRHGARQVELTSDEEGQFEGVLPRPGLWPVDVVTADFETRVRAQVEPRRGKPWAELTIRLPDTEVFGRVVDARGQPVADATVRVTTEGWGNTTQTKAEGRFVSRAIVAGPVQVAAERKTSGKPLLVSDEVRAELVEGQPLGPLELRLREIDRVSGRVLRGSQPVPGAVVSLWARGGSGYAEQATSDADGAFSVKVDPNAPGWIVTILPPGGALTVFERPNDGSPLTLQAEPEGGELTLDLPATSEELSAGNFELSLSRQGVEIALFWLLEWRRTLGLPLAIGPEVRSFTVPRMAPGTYVACLGRYGALLGPEGDTRAGRACRSGQLTAGGTLTLKVPKLAE